MASDVPRRGPDQVDRDPVALYGPGLECPAPRPVRRANLPAASGDQPERAGRGPHRWRVPAAGATAPSPVPWHRDPDSAWPRVSVHDARASGALVARLVGRTRPARGV